MAKHAATPAAGFREQVRRNSVALISLAVALSSLSYNTWRNEQTEENRNLRFAAFEVLLKLGELQRLARLDQSGLARGRRCFRCSSRNAT